MERMTDFPGEKFAKRFALYKGMEAKPSRKKDQNEQGEDENQKTNAFHADEIRLRMELIPVAGRPFPRLFGYLVPIASGVVAHPTRTSAKNRIQDRFLRRALRFKINPMTPSGGRIKSCQYASGGGAGGFTLSRVQTVSVSESRWILTSSFQIPL